MATANQTARDKFLEARKAGVDAVTARKQAYGDVIPAQAGGVVQANPIPPVSQPVTPTPPPQPINQQTMQGVDGQTFQVAPVNAQGVTPQAPAPAQPVQPTTPVTPTATPEKTTVAPVDKTAEIKAQNEAQMALNKQKSQLAIQERKQQEADAKMAAMPVDQKSIVQALISGAIVPRQNTPEYRNANTIYSQFKKYNSMTDTELLSNLKQGNIGSELDGYLQANPNYAAAKQKLAQQQKIDSLNRIGQSVMNVANGSEPVDLADLSKVEAKYTAPVGVNEQAYLDHVTNNPDVIKTGTELKRIATQISETSTVYNTALKDLQKQYSGKLSASALLTLMGSRTRDTKDLIDSLVNAKDLAKGDFDLAMKMAEGEYGAVQQDIAQQQKLESEARQQQYAQENAIFQANLGLQNRQAEFEQSLAQQAQLATDPISGTNAIIDTFEKMGIMADRSRQEIIADVQAKVASGIPLGRALSELQTAFKSKPLYKSMVAAQMASLAPETPKPTATWTKIGVNADGSDKYGFVDASTGTVSPYNVTGDLRNLADQFPGQAWAKNNNPAGITWNANFDKGTGTAKLFADAGIQFSKGTARPASEGGNYVTFNTIEDGLKAQQILMTQTYGNSTVGKMLSSWVGTSEGPNYAKQVAGMAGITDLNAKVSSLSPEQISALQMAKIKKESPGLYGILSQSEGTAVSSDAQNYFNLIQKGTTSYEDVFKKLGGSKVGQALMNEINSLIAAKGGAIPAPPDSEQVKKMDDLIGRLDTLLEDDGNKLESVSGLTYGSLWDKTFGYSKEQALGNLKFVLKGNTLQQLIDAKAQGATFGALSNEELRMLQESASPILAFAQEDENKNIKGFKVDEATLKAEVKKLRDLFTEKRAKMVNPGINQGIPMPNQEVTGMQGGTGAGQTQTYQGYTLKPF